MVAKGCHDEIPTLSDIPKLPSPARQGKPLNSEFVPRNNRAFYGLLWASIWAVEGPPQLFRLHPNPCAPLHRLLIRRLSWSADWNREEGWPRSSDSPCTTPLRLQRI
jgi:hypothetical protein